MLLLHCLTLPCTLRSLGLRLVLADINQEQLAIAGQELLKACGEGNVLVVPTDVRDAAQVVSLKNKAYEAFGEVGLISRWAFGSLWTRSTYPNFKGLRSPQ